MNAYKDHITSMDLHMLLRAHDEPVVSICMPVRHVEAEVQQNLIRLKNLLREAEQHLIAGGVKGTVVEETLRPAHEMVEKGKSFWLHQSAGLVLFLGPEGFYTYGLPLQVEACVVVGPRFYVRPLIRVLQQEGRFFVLTLSQGGIHLFEATRFNIREVALKDVPQSLDEALRYDVNEQHLQFHTGAAGQVGGRRAAVFHGQGAASDDARSKKNILRFFRQVDNGVRDVLAEEQAPLVLAGIDYLQGLYREANHYAFLADEGIAGNPDHLSAADLHRLALEAVASLLETPRKEAVSTYRRLSGTTRAAHDLPSVVPAAYHRRVDTLFVPVGARCWGTFDPADLAVEQHAQALPGNVDLLDEALAYTLLNNGKIYVLPPDDMPATPIAAIFRY